MKIILEHEDINTALVNYVASLGIDLSGKDIVVELTAGRKENGNSAAIEITNKKKESTISYVESLETPIEATEVEDEGVPVEVEINDEDEIFR